MQEVAQKVKELAHKVKETPRTAHFLCGNITQKPQGQQYPQWLSNPKTHISPKNPTKKTKKIPHFSILENLIFFISTIRNQQNRNTPILV